VDARGWTPRELRRSFVSLLPTATFRWRLISRLVGHKNKVVAELINRKQIRPVGQTGAEAMDHIF
jgi:hypothetical protein